LLEFEKYVQNKIRKKEKTETPKIPKKKEKKNETDQEPPEPENKSKKNKVTECRPARSRTWTGVIPTDRQLGEL
jgi:hypothetical protein